MSALIEIIGSLTIAGFIVWGFSTETPAVARVREVDEDEQPEPIEWGPGDEF